MLFVVRPLFKPSDGAGFAVPALAMAAGGGAIAGALPAPAGGAAAGGAQAQIAYDPQTGQQLLAAPGGGGGELEGRLDIARIEGQVKASSVKQVAEFVEKHPDESVSILRSWLHEA
jgi:flagellar M-ring protein FliF